MNVRLRLKVSSSGLPAEFTVRDFNGNIVFYRKRVNAENFFCFCSRSKHLIFTVRPINSDYTEKSEFLHFPCAKCVSLGLNFNFPEPVYPPTVQRFTLSDATYFFPVESAVMTFK